MNWRHSFTLKTTTNTVKLSFPTATSSLLARMFRQSMVLAKTSISTSRIMPVYAVRVGKVPGIYDTWKECQEQVIGFPGSQFKKFKTVQEAQGFIDNKFPSNSQPSKTSGIRSSSSHSQNSSVTSSSVINGDHGGPRRDAAPPFKRAMSSVAGDLSQKRRYSTTAAIPRSGSDGHVSPFSHESEDTGLVPIVYTDGCCLSNGKSGALAGIGVFWGDDSPDNLAEPLVGRATNNRAEIHAAVRAITQAKSRGLKKINIHTDSQFLVNSMTLWVHKWIENDWRGSSGKVINREDFEALLKAMDGIEVEWTHIYGHQGNVGNTEADRLANEGARKTLLQISESDVAAL